VAYSDVKNASICEWILDNDTGDSTRMLTVFEDMTASNAESDATIGVSARQARAAGCILNDRIFTVFTLRDKRRIGMHPRVFPLSAFILFFYTSAAFCVRQPLLWSQRFGGESWASGSSVAVDASGNVFLAGSFAGSVDFGGGPLVSAGGEDIFVAKFDPSGSHLWSRQVGDTCFTGTQSIAVDASGNVFLAGSFGGGLDFGGGQLKSAGGYDIFLAKFDPNGAHVWSRRFGDIDDYQEALGVAVGPSGNVVIAGYYRGTVDFGGGPLVSAGGEDIFVATFNPSGTHVWSRRFGDPDWQVARSVTVNTIGQVIFAGEFYGQVDFGGGSLVSAGSGDIFITKLNSSGTYLWSRRFGDAEWQEAWGVAVDPSQNMFLTGDFDGTLNFGTGSLVSEGGDIFLAKFTPTGVQWSRRFGDRDYQHAQSLAADPSGNLYLTGYFFGTVDFGGGPLVQVGNTYDLYLAKFDPTGAHMWSQRFGDVDWEETRSVAVDPGGNAFLTGSFGGKLDFGAEPLVCDGDYDIFLAKFEPPEFCTAVFEVPTQPRIALHPNYPNPFNPGTTIPYALPSEGIVNLAIYDIFGRTVRTLVVAPKTAGEHAASWDGRDEGGSLVASGVYFVRVEAGGQAATRKILLLK